MKKINVIDSVMGSGKTSWAIQYMKEACGDERFIYVTPFLAEVERIKKEVSSRHFIEPNNANEERRKMRSLKELIVKGADIATTHSLFQMADDELIALLTDGGYTLILDEVMDVVEPVNVTRRGIQRLLDSGDIIVEGNRVQWVGAPDNDDRYQDIYYLANAGNLYMHKGTMLVWSFPPSVFRAMDKAFIMTYLFNGSLQRNYFDLHGFEYEFSAVTKVEDQFELIAYDKQNERRGELFALIDMYDGKLNDIGSRKNALSASYLRRADTDVLKPIKDNLYNYLRHVTKAKLGEAYWSTLQDVEKAIAPRGHKGSHIAVNARATNDYAECQAIAYMFNSYAHPSIMSFFHDNGVKVNEELFAVGNLLQWIWRSRIRNGEPINLYLPSSRMRRLFKSWANYEI